MKKFIAMLIAAALLLCGCNLKDGERDEEAYSFRDARGNNVTVSSIERVVVLYGSFAEAWLNAGGELSGTTEDAVKERGLDLSEKTKIVGTVKEPNIEEIIALDPTLVILSADIEKQTEIGESLGKMNVPCAYMRIDYFEDYLHFLRISCDLTEREDLYKKNGTDVKVRIDSILSEIPAEENRTVLFLRAYSSGAKAKKDDNFAAAMLTELGCVNIAQKHPSLLEDLSMEEIILEDPEYIFVSTMGDEEKALTALSSGIGANPAWSELSAVKNDRFIVLPKELFHYKPNARWDESYRYLAEILYPEIFN